MLAQLEGSVLEPGELLATVALDDPTKVHKAELYTGRIDSIDHGSKRLGDDGSSPAAHPPHLPRRSDVALTHATAVLTNAIDGYHVPSESVRGAGRPAGRHTG